MTTPALARRPRIDLAASVPGPVRQVEACMGTVFSIDVRPVLGIPQEVALVAVARAFSWLHWVDATFSPYRPDSDISRLRRGEVTVSGCAPEVGAVLTRCAELRDETGGYFSAYAGGTLDPSGLVKGWAIARTSELLRTAGLDRHCVNGGGDVQCAGLAAGGLAWRVGIAHPLDRTLLAGVIAVTDAGVATSGSAERDRHIIDPTTGLRPGELASVTVVGPSVASADAYATAAFAMGLAAPAWLESLADRGDYRGLVVFADGSRWSSLIVVDCR